MPESVRGSSSTMRISVGQLVAGEHAAGVGQQVVGADGAGVAAQLDGRDRHRAEAAVVAADHRGAPHRGVPLERGPHVVGQHLEAAADDRLVGPTEDPEEPVVVDAGQVGGADPAAVAELPGLAPRAGPRRRRRPARPVSASTTRSSQPGVGPADAPPLGRPELRWSSMFHPATPPPNSVAA